MTVVIARSEATKQSILRVCGFMDCFASLAMTDVELIGMMTEGKYNALA
jgi:hypothetical protein